MNAINPMTPARFGQIKTAIEQYKQSHVTALDLAGLGDIFGMLIECACELERVRTIPQTRRRGHLKPVVLDARGQPVLPVPLSQQFEVERREQYALERYEALMSLDPLQWRTFALRWGMTPPPGGWSDHELIIDTMHTIRLHIESIPYQAKHLSAMHLIAKNKPLPEGMSVSDGVLHGTRNNP